MVLAFINQLGKVFYFLPKTNFKRDTVFSWYIQKSTMTLIFGCFFSGYRLSDTVFFCDIRNSTMISIFWCLCSRTTTLTLIRSLVQFKNIGKYPKLFPNFTLFHSPIQIGIFIPASFHILTNKQYNKINLCHFYVNNLLNLFYFLI